MTSIISNIKNAKDGSIKERIKSEFPDFNCVSEGYTQVFNGVEEGMKKSLSNFIIDICELLKKSIEIADQYNEPDIFETSPYTFTPPQTLIEYYVAKYLRGRLDKERWNLLFKKPINGVVHDIRLVEKELPQTGEKTPKRKQKLRTIIIDLFAELWLFPLSNSDFIQNRKAEFPAITLDELVAKMEASGVTPENYFVALIVLPTNNDGEGIDLDELAERLGIPRKNLSICKLVNITNFFEELISMIRSLSILFEPEEENINIRKK
ncbi:hypothetical protein [Capnocytophaga leadbetteri]|uniref:hypothetical protein n=1 Tax=Capnocytophaga leadbetteri TaxID=327575 RepID=UPI0028E361CE|nr:hypothetical protein [Capnocytophaga leadbetteri]